MGNVADEIRKRLDAMALQHQQTAISEEQVATQKAPKQGRKIKDPEIFMNPDGESFKGMTGMAAERKDQK